MLIVVVSQWGDRCTAAQQTAKATADAAADANFAEFLQQPLLSALVDRSTNSRLGNKQVMLK